MATIETGSHLIIEAAFHESCKGRLSASHAMDFARFKLDCPPPLVDRKVKVFSPDGIIASFITDLLCK